MNRKKANKKITIYGLMALLTFISFVVSVVTYFSSNVLKGSLDSTLFPFQDMYNFTITAFLIAAIVFVICSITFVIQTILKVWDFFSPLNKSDKNNKK